MRESKQPSRESTIHQGQMTFKIKWLRFSVAAYPISTVLSGYYPDITTSLTSGIVSNLIIRSNTTQIGQNCVPLQRAAVYVFMPQLPQPDIVSPGKCHGYPTVSFNSLQGSDRQSPRKTCTGTDIWPKNADGILGYLTIKTNSIWLSEVKHSFTTRHRPYKRSRSQKARSICIYRDEIYSLYVVG